jgi:hypothetical protein
VTLPACALSAKRQFLAQVTEAQVFVNASAGCRPWQAFAPEPFFHHWGRGPAKDLANAIKGAFLISELLNMSSPVPQ